jgi:hypothetical protein
MALEKVGEIKLELVDAPSLVNLLNDILKWDKEELLNYSKEKFPWCKKDLDCIIDLHPRFILLPQYAYSFYPYCIKGLIESGALDIKLADKIHPKYFTTYNIYRSKPSNDPCDLIGGFDMEIRIKPSEDEDKVRISNLGVVIFGYETRWGSCKYKKICRGHLNMSNSNDLLVSVRDSIDNLTQAVGEDYSKHRVEEYHSGRGDIILQSAKLVEYTFINFLTLAYTLFTEEYDKDWVPEHIIFKTATKTLQDLGSTFEEVIKVIRSFSLILGI